MPRTCHSRFHDKYFFIIEITLYSRQIKKVCHVVEIILNYIIRYYLAIFINKYEFVSIENPYIIFSKVKELNYAI